MLLSKPTDTWHYAQGHQILRAHVASALIRSRWHRRAGPSFGKKMELYAGWWRTSTLTLAGSLTTSSRSANTKTRSSSCFGDNGAEGTDLFKMIAGTPGTRDFLFAAINWSQNKSQRGRPGFVCRLWADVGAGIHDAIQPIQGMAGGRRHPQRAHCQRPECEAG